MSKYSLCFTIGVFLGVLSCFLFQLVVFPETFEPSRSSYPTQSSGDMEKGIQLLCQEIRRLGDSIRMSRQPYQPPQNIRSKEEPTTQEREKITAQNNTPLFHSSSRVIAMDWAGYLDKELSIAMIEVGKTPYDPGMGVLVRSYSDKIRDLNKRKDKAVELWLNRYKDAKLDSNGKKQKSVEYKAISDQFADEKKKLIEAFREILVSGG